MNQRHRLFGLLAAAFLALPGKALAIDVVSMYRGSCQVDTGVVLRVDTKSVTYLDLQGTVRKIPRYEIVGVASYPLPWLPVKNVTVPSGVDVDIFTFQTYLGGKLAPLAKGWPIEYNAEHIQVLTLGGKDHLVLRDDIWGVATRSAPKHLAFSTVNDNAAGGSAYKLRHPLAFERCPDNVTPGRGTPIPVIPQVTYDNPIAIKRYHDHLRDGYLKVQDYAERQRFYAVPRYYTNRTLLGTWGLIGSRYANVGARQVNFLPLVQDEYSEGPFGFQRVVRSGVAPLSWGLHEEPTVQIFYGLKADYVHLEVFFDPTSPLIGDQYDYSRGQLNPVDDRLVEKGGLEFGFDVGYFSAYLAYSEGDMAIRARDYFTHAGFGSARYGVSFQYNYYKIGFYAGSNPVALDDDLKQDFRFLKVLGQAPLGPSLRLKAQLIRRELADSDDVQAPLTYNSVSQTIAGEVDWDLNYRWTFDVLGSVERQQANYTGKTFTGDGQVSKIYPKLASGVTVAF